MYIYWCYYKTTEKIQVCGIVDSVTDMLLATSFSHFPPAPWSNLALEIFLWIRKAIECKTYDGDRIMLTREGRLFDAS